MTETLNKRDLEFLDILLRHDSPSSMYGGASHQGEPSTVYAVAKGAGGAIGARIDNLFDHISNSVFGSHGHLVNNGYIPPPTPTPAIAVVPAPLPPPPPAPAIPAPPVNVNHPSRRRGSGRRGRPSSTTRHGHPDSGYFGGNQGGSGGGRLKIDH
ncbi:MAG: hypothetical protein ACOH2R_17555 [Pseudomonas sp.]